jgi:acetyl esterase/lipase
MNTKKLISILLLLATFPVVAQFNSAKNFAYNKIDGQYSHLLSMDIYSPLHGENLPVMVFVHGGGWQAGDKANVSHINKRNFFVSHGFVFVSINYRLAPEEFYPTYPQDVAQALSYVFNWIGKFRGDNHKVYLMGHSAGAHLAALVATDEHYLNDLGFELSDLSGVILLDGAGYDIPALMQDNYRKNNQSGIETYTTAFGENEDLWLDASPVSHVSVDKYIPPIQLFYPNPDIETQLRV